METNSPSINLESLRRRAVHPFPARMAASIPWDTLCLRRRRLRVLDPMAGSGTAAIVARATGHKALAYDLDPLAVLIARVGTATVRPDRIVTCAQGVLHSAQKLDVKGANAYPAQADDETREFVRYWFDLGARKQLAALSTVIEGISDAGIRDFLWCALSRMIITKDAGVSLARDVSHGRPHKMYHRSPIKPFEAFKESLERVLTACLFNDGCQLPAARIKRGDARRLPLPDASIDLVVTSPPYLNAIDYMRGHKLSLVWMGHKVDELRGLRSASIGAESWDHAQDEAKISSIVKSMGAVKKLPQAVQRMISRYVRDMDGVIGEIARVLEPGGQALMVLGDSTLRGVYVRNSVAIRALAEAHKMKTESIRRRKIPDKHRYLPPPRNKSGEELAKRMRTEVLLTFRK